MLKEKEIEVYISYRNITHYLKLGYVPTLNKNMKINNLLYILSLVILLGSIYLAVEYQDSGRIQFIAGILTMVGLGMNIVGYAMKK